MLPFAYPVAPQRERMTSESLNFFEQRIELSRQNADKTTVECLLFKEASAKPGTGTLWCGMGNGFLMVSKGG